MRPADSGWLPGAGSWAWRCGPGGRARSRLCAASSSTECAAKNAASASLRVASEASALAPFSQNSANERSPSGSGQAQLGQSKPPAWFISSSPRVPRNGPASRRMCSSDETTAGMPAAHCLGSDRISFSSSCIAPQASRGMVSCSRCKPIGTPANPAARTCSHSPVRISPSGPGVNSVSSTTHRSHCRIAPDDLHARGGRYPGSGCQGAGEKGLVSEPAAYPPEDTPSAGGGVPGRR